MRTPLLLPLLVLLLSLPALPACKANRPAADAAQLSASQPTTAPTTATTIAPRQQEPVLLFGRSACLGTCPDYTARFFADGRLVYEGRKYAPVEGQYTVTISPAVVEQLLREADQLGFYELRDVYSKGAVDLPATTLSITTSRGTKTVRVEEGGPAALRQLFTHLDQEVTKAVAAQAK